MDRFVLRTGNRLFRAVRKAACVDLRSLVIIPYKNDKQCNGCKGILSLFWMEYSYFAFKMEKEKKLGELKSF